MVDIGDVRLEGVSHEEIMRWVGQGDAESTTHVFEARMQALVSTLYETSENTNKAVQRANAGDWQGTTAESAHGAMVTMRDYDDAMHGHSENNRYSAMGQSGESAATRSRVPLPVPLPSAGGNRPTLVDATTDPHGQLDARRSAEQQARQVMGEYRDATQARVSALPSIPPVPKVVLDTGHDAPAPKPGSQSSSRHGGDAPGVPGGSAQGTSSFGSTGGTSSTHGAGQGGQHVSAPPAAQGTDPSSVGAPPSVGPGSTGNAPGGSWGGVPGGSSSGSGGSGPGGSGTPSWAGAPGGSRGPGGSGGSGESGQAGGRGAAGAQPGARSGAGLAGAEEAALARRGGAAGAGRPGGPGPGGMMGGGHGAEGDEDSEHTNKYGLPSDEHFDEDDEFLRDPRNRDFFVAPDVIGGPE